MEKLKAAFKGLVKSRNKQITDSTAGELTSTFERRSTKIENILEAHPEIAGVQGLSSKDMVVLNDMKSTLIKNPTPEAFQEILNGLPEGRTDLVKIISLLFERIVKSNRFNNLDVEWMNENDEAFKGKNFSKEDLQLLQNVIEELKKDNSRTNTHKVAGLLPDDRIDLNKMIGYLHFKVMFNN